MKLVGLEGAGLYPITNCLDLVGDRSFHYLKMLSSNAP